jgi:hypothetical protein
MRKIIKRFKEPSTWAGVSILAAVFGVPAVTADAVTGALSALVGLADPGITGTTVSNALTALAAVAAILVPEKEAAR